MHTNKSSQKPLRLFHGNSGIFGKQNSVELIQRAVLLPVDIIELDIRKSNDGILYCYHGGVFACFLKYFSFKSVNQILSVDKLADLLLVIPQQKIVFLDIKDNTITAGDLKPIFNHFNHHFWLAAYSLKYLYQLKLNLGNQHKYIYNFGFIFFNRGIRIAKKLGINNIKIFVWQCNEKNMEKIYLAGLNFTIEELFLNKNKLSKLIAKFGSFWLSVDGEKYE